MPTPSPLAEDEPPADIELDEDDQALHPDPSLVSQYLAHLYAHNSDVRSHITGSPQTKDGHVSASYFAPNVYWTAKEKDTFFHALSVHSRLRPDLVAEEIGTKTLADVCTYIDLLEGGLKRSELSVHNPANQVVAEFVDFESLPREDFPIAHEVCDEWIDLEETLAEAVIAQEQVMVAESLRDARSEEKRQYQLQVRARKGAGRLADNSRDREGEKVRKKQIKQWAEEKEKAWKEEDVLNGMDVALMRAVDMLVREHEETKALAGHEQLNDSQRNISALSEPRFMEAAGGSVEPRAQLPKAFDNFDEEFIDPSLRASSSAPTAVHTPQPEDISRPRTPDPPALNPHDNSRPRAPSFNHLHPTDSSSTLIGPGRTTPSASEAEAPLSPASRRRLMKRMYMRRKRAEQSGGQVNATTARLKPGRKPMKRPDEPHDEDEPTRHPRWSGKPQQLKKKDNLGVQGITAEWLEQENLDLFHFGALHKLMRTYQGLHDVPDDVVSEISIHTLRLLRDQLVQFVLKTVRRSVVSREQEMSAKMHTKVWRLAENQVVTVTNVSHAVSLLGLEYHDKKTHFERLLQRLDLAEADFTDGEDGEPSSASAKRKGKLQAKPHHTDADSEDEPAPDTLPPLLEAASTHRIVFPPFVRLPGPMSQSPDTLLAHIPWAHGLGTDAPAELEDEDEDARDAAEAGELLEDAELDRRDRVLAKECEDRLFEGFGVRQERRTFTDAFGTWDGSRVERWPRRMAEAGEGSGRKRKKAKTKAMDVGRRRKRVKTTEFVYDSDEVGEVGEVGDEDEDGDEEEDESESDENEENEKSDDEEMNDEAVDEDKVDENADAENEMENGEK